MVRYELLWMQQHRHCHPTRGDRDSTRTTEHSPAAQGGRAGGIPRSILPPVPRGPAGGGGPWEPSSPPKPCQGPTWAARGLRSWLAPLQHSSPTL